MYCSLSTSMHPYFLMLKYIQVHSAQPDTIIRNQFVKLPSQLLSGGQSLVSLVNTTPRARVDRRTLGAQLNRQDGKRAQDIEGW